MTNIPTPPQPADSLQTVVINKVRADLAYEAVAEVDAIARMLAREYAVNGDDLVFGLILATNLNRLLDLASVGLSALGDDTGRDTAEMFEVVNHRKMEADHV